MRRDSSDEIAATEESTLSAMTALLEQRKKTRKGRGSLPSQSDENEEIIDAMMNLVAEQNRIMAMRMGDRASYDHASAVLEESTMLGAMSLMVDRLYVRSRMSTTLLQGDLAVDSELIQSMSSLIEARREVIETYTIGGPALMRRDTDEDLFTMMAELIETHTLNGEEPDDEMLDAMDVLIERVWEKKHGGGAPEEDEELIAALASIGRKSARKG